LVWILTFFSLFFVVEQGSEVCEEFLIFKIKLPEMATQIYKKRTISVLTTKLTLNFLSSKREVKSVS
jgi:hypothetical protein